MQLKIIPTPFKKARPIIDRLEQAGFLAYFVGGSLRDSLLKRPIHDVDIATSAYPEEIKKIFPKTIDVGIEHGTVLVLWNKEAYEVTTFRTESTYQDYRRPDQVTFVQNLEEDLKRRDFTINALAMGKDGKIIDLFDGMADLRKKTIRCVGNPKERFHEDALRMMRAFRFCAELNFSLEKSTETAINENISLLKKISVERINQEFVKLLKSSNRITGLRPFFNAHAQQYVPYLAEYADNLKQLLNFRIHKYFPETAQVWTIVAILGKIPLSFLPKFLRAWKESRKVSQQTCRLVATIKNRKNNFYSKMDLYKLGLSDAILVEEICQFLWGTGKQEKVRQMFKALKIKSAAEININGSDLIKELKIKPGPKIGKMLSLIEEKVVNDKLANEYEQLLEFLRTNSNLF